MPNPIPEASRRIVENRDGMRCVRCGAPGSEWHHRRGRAVVDRHQHCACNGILLCHTCHTYAHRYPTIAASMGFIVSRYESRPASVLVHTAQGWSVMTCDGDVVWVDPRNVVIDEGVPVYTE